MSEPQKPQLITHPDSLTLPELMYLQDPVNAEFLKQYQNFWKEIMEERRKTKQ